MLEFSLANPRRIQEPKVIFKMKQEKIKHIDKELSELVENIMMAKSKFNNNSVLNVIASKNVVNDESKLLASYGYELEKLILKRVLLEKGFEEIAEDFDKSASYPKHKDNIVIENTSIVQSSCKLFGEHIDVVFQKIRDNFHEYLSFLAEDAAGPRRFVKQAVEG